MPLSQNWYDAEIKVRDLLVGLTHDTTVIDRVFRNISGPYSEELHICVVTENEYVMAHDVLTIVDVFKLKLNEIYRNKVISIRCIRVSNKAPQQMASVTLIVKFASSVWEDK